VAGVGAHMARKALGIDSGNLAMMHRASSRGGHPLGPMLSGRLNRGGTNVRAHTE
jgi:hypothetical protein